MLAVRIGGGAGGGPVGGGGDFILLPLRLMRDEIDDEEIDDEDVDVVEPPPIVVDVAEVLIAPLSNGFTRSCGSKLVTGLYLFSCSKLSKTLEDGLLL